MVMRKIIVSPVDYQNHVDQKRVDNQLKDAIHVETYTYDDGGFGNRRTIVIFAFYPGDFILDENGDDR